MTQGFSPLYTSSGIIAPNKNIIIASNYDLNPWQRGTSFAGLTASSTYTADRFSWNTSGSGVVTVSRQADGPTVSQCGVSVQNCLEIAVTTASATLAASDYYNFTYKMEGYDWVQLYQVPFTFSAWIKPSISGTLCFSFNDSGFDTSYIKAVPVTSNVWQQVVINVPASPSLITQNFTNGVGLYINWTIAAGSNFNGTAGAWTTQATKYNTSGSTNGMSSTSNTFKITLMKVEPGFYATPYVTENITSVIEKCQRYFQTSYQLGTAPGSISSAGIRNFIAVTAFNAGSNLTSDNFLTRMRVNLPTITIYSAQSGSANNYYNNTAGTDEPGSASETSQTSYVLSNTNAIPAANQTLQWQFSANAEL